MSLLFDLPLYVLYALLGTGAASLVKLALAHLAPDAAGRRDWLRAGFAFVGGCASLAGNLGLLVYLLARADMSVMAPVAIATNLLVAAVLARLMFRERFNAWKLAGFGCLAVGMIAVTLG